MTTITEKLLDAAEYRMRRGGYNAVSFRDLASDTDIKSSSVHYHFPKKEDLGIALIDRYAKRFFEVLVEEAAAAESAREKLEAFQAVYRRAFRQDRAVCLCGLLGAELAGLPEGLAAGIRAFFGDNIAWVEGALPLELSNVERHSRASTVVAAHQGAITLAVSLNDHEMFERITDNVIETVINLG